MFKIVKTPQNTQQLDELRKKLTVTPLTNSPIPWIKVPPIQLFLESERTLRIPFAYAVNKAKIATKDDVARRLQAIEANATKVDFAFSGSIRLRDYQEIGCAKVINSLKNTTGAMLCMGCGYGKTICAVYVMSQLKKKTIVFVHKQFLAEEFKTTIEMCMPGTPVSIIQGPVCDTSGSIVIAMIQSVMNKDYPRDMFSQFGLAVYDEAHHSAASCFSRAVTVLGSINTLSLSATPVRADGLKPEWLVGKIAYRYEGLNQCHPQVIMLDYSDEKPIDFVFNRAGVLCQASMMNNLVLDQDRNRLIVDSLEKIYQKNEEDIEEDPEAPRRFILVVSDRRGHLEQLHDLTQESEVLKKYKTSFAVGGMKAKIFEENCKTADILLATYQMVSEGFNQIRLSAIFLTTPKGNVVQSIGRVMRTAHNIPVLIIDINDVAIYSYKPSLKRRLTLYKSREYPVINCTTLDLDQPIVDVDEQAGGVVDGVPVTTSGEVDFSQCLL